MKKGILFLIIVWASNTTFGQLNDLKIQTNKSKQLPSNSNAIDLSWQSSAQNYITKMGYDFRRNEKPGIFTASNNHQHVAFTVTNAGFKVTPLKTSSLHGSTTEWEEGLTLSEVRKGGNHLYSSSDYTVNQEKDVLHFTYHGFSIQYINNEKGLRQNFIIDKDAGGSEKLEVLLHHQGQLSPSLQDNGITFTNTKGVTKLFYKDLKVWDARNRILEAVMEIRDENTVAIVVNDKNATYPVTIDPLNHTPDWTGSAQGIIPGMTTQNSIDAGYGYTVAGLGDVNGDGFDDVAIGAPAMANFISGTGTLANVGAVFVYFGSPTGLPLSPTAMLQPNTLVAGALFGYSIAGGDVNNDGKSDIVVGAPKDNVTINSTSATIGRVYVFNGATLTTTTTPLLTIQLSGNTIIQPGVNFAVNGLFGFSVGVTQDLNGDGKKDIIVGAPEYAGIKLDGFGNPTILDVQSGGAFVFLTHALNDSLTLVKLEPIKADILGAGLASDNLSGLLFGYSVDGLGDYNGDGIPDVVASAPAGVDVSSLSALLSGKLLQGSATVYYGTGAGVNVNPGAVLTASSGGLVVSFTGPINNVANLFGNAVRGITGFSGLRTGNVIVGAPLGGVLVSVLGLQLKTGTVNVFKKKLSSPVGNVNPDQVLSSPRNTNNILSLIQSNVLFGYSLDNVLDVNCDGIADIIVGEPVSSGVQLINANVSGGAAYVYLGVGDGTYQANPAWTLTVTEDALLGANATSLIGYSVAGARKTRGATLRSYVLAGTPSRTLDFGAGLLNLGSTYATLFSLVAGDNGVGKAYLFETALCSGVLPLNMTQLKGNYSSGIAHLTWSTLQETNSSHFDIEHSTDGINFQYIGQVEAAGFSSKEIAYHYNDLKASAGANYYRLKATDQDHRYVYSNVVLLNVTIKGISITGFYPNPFIDKVNISISSETNEKANIRMLDNTGKVISTQTSMVSKGVNNIILGNMANLARGLYIVEIQVGDVLIKQKLIK